MKEEALKLANELHRKHGGKIYVNPFIKLERVGTYVYGGDITKAGGNLK